MLYFRRHIPVAWNFEPSDSRDFHDHIPPYPKHQKETNMNNHEYKLDKIPIHTDVYGGLFVFFSIVFVFTTRKTTTKSIRGLITS